MRVLFCTSEIYPFVKTGGLGDVSAALPPALARLDVDIRLFVPGFDSIIDALTDVKTLVSFPVYFGNRDVRILTGRLPNGLTTYVLDAPEFWNRTGAYVDEQGQDWPDNHYRFAAFCRAITDLPIYDPSWRADILHGNDWQCGLIAPYILQKPEPRPKTILTIHNIAYQGLFAPEILPSIGFPGEFYTMSGGEFFGKIGYLKSSLAFSDHITTVSPTYAREIQDSDQGCGLQDFLKTRPGNITGILNGIDTDIWNPKTDRDIWHRYDASHLKDRAKNKTALLKECGLKDNGKPLFAVVSRLGYQKGFDLFLSAAPRLLQLGGQLIVLGSGDRDLEDGFTQLAAQYPKQVYVRIGYSEDFAHKIQAGADVIAMPSRSEPCGLVQLYAMRYGAIPFVHKVGGLADTVTDIQQNNATGFVFDEPTVDSIENKLPEIFAAFSEKKHWETLQKTAMKQNHGWDVSAKEYISLYANLLSPKK